MSPSRAETAKAWSGISPARRFSRPPDHDRSHRSGSEKYSSYLPPSSSRKTPAGEVPYGHNRQHFPRPRPQPRRRPLSHSCRILFGRPPEHHDPNNDQIRTVFRPEIALIEITSTGDIYQKLSGNSLFPCVNPRFFPYSNKWLITHSKILTYIVHKFSTKLRQNRFETGIAHQANFRNPNLRNVAKSCRLP